MFVYNEVLIAVFLLCITIQFGYALYFFTQIFRLPNHNPNDDRQPLDSAKPVTVIICAKNEAANLQLNLPLILAQRYANEAGIAMYEVIVVNDASTDETEDVLKKLQIYHSNLHVINVAANEERTLPGKKFALSKAIALAKYEYILMTDADCSPASAVWLSHMVEPLHKGKEIVAGYGKYITEKGLLNTFTRWETLHTFIQYASYAMAGKPYMAVGRNLACTKQALLNAQKTKEWSMLPSGDDDLLVSSQATAYNMAVVADASSFTASRAKQTWAAWLKQKQRHTSTGKYYKTSTKLLLSLYAMSHAALWVLFFLLLPVADTQLLMGMLARCVVYWLIWHSAAKKLNEKNLVQWFPVADIGWMLYNFVLSPYIFLKNKRQWT